MTVIVDLAQRRHRWTNLKATSNYKLTIKQWLPARKQWYSEVRPLLKRLQILRQRPHNYSAHTHREKWDKPGWKVNHKSCANIDEIPYAHNWGTGQLVAPGERVSLKQDAIRRLNKYRKGTITLCTTATEVLLAVIILRGAGGPVVQERLRRQERSDGALVVMLGNKKGTMNAATWRVTCDLLAQRTRVRRGVKGPDSEGNWQHALVLFVDNYEVHLEEDNAARCWHLYGIAIVPFIKNASHIMQPVDRNVGITCKDKFKSSMLMLLIRIQRRTTECGRSLEINMEKFQQLTMGMFERTIRWV